MAEGALEVETLSSAELGAGGGGASGGGSGAAGSETDLPAQLEGQVDLHVDESRDLVLGAAGVQSGEMETGDEMVTEPVLGMRMLMSSRVSSHAALCICLPKAPRWPDVCVHVPFHGTHTHVQFRCRLNYT
jgi:hypothetical protein